MFCLISVEKTKGSVASFREDQDFPITIQLKDKYIKTCINEQLTQQKSFIVQKCESERRGYDWDFKASLKLENCKDKKDVLSELNAEKYGHCDLVETLKSSQGCGLATSLMELCFKDDDVGGVNLEEDKNFKNKVLESRREMAILNCEHIVFLTCAPIQPTPKGSCSAYLTAAINTGHAMMFSYPSLKGQMDIMDVEKTARPQLKMDADAFVQNHGDEWYFCRCKPDRIKECHEMS